VPAHSVSTACWVSSSKGFATEQDIRRVSPMITGNNPVN
jgi:hypothetical protein